MKNKLPLLIGAIVVIAGLVFFMGGGDKTAKKSGDSSAPIVIPTPYNKSYYNYSTPSKAFLY